MNVWHVKYPIKLFQRFSWRTLEFLEMKAFHAKTESSSNTVEKRIALMVMKENHQ